MTTAKAKRGDLVALVRRQHDYVIGEVGRDCIRVDIVEVASITREGVVKAVRDLDGTTSRPIERVVGLEKRLVIPAATIDKAAAVAAVLAHTWPGHTTVKPFDSLDEARDTLRPFLVRRPA